MDIEEASRRTLCEKGHRLYGEQACERCENRKDQETYRDFILGIETKRLNNSIRDVDSAIKNREEYSILSKENQILQRQEVEALREIADAILRLFSVVKQYLV